VNEDKCVRVLLSLKKESRDQMLCLSFSTDLSTSTYKNHKSYRTHGHIDRTGKI